MKLVRGGMVVSFEDGELVYDVVGIDEDQKFVRCKLKIVIEEEEV